MEVRGRGVPLRREEARPREHLDWTARSIYTRRDAASQVWKSKPRGLGGGHVVWKEDNNPEGKGQREESCQLDIRGNRNYEKVNPIAMHFDPPAGEGDGVHPGRLGQYEQRVGAVEDGVQESSEQEG